MMNSCIDEKPRLGVSEAASRGRPDAVKIKENREKEGISLSAVEIKPSEIEWAQAEVALEAAVDNDQKDKLRKKAEEAKAKMDKELKPELKPSSSWLMSSPGRFGV